MLAIAGGKGGCGKTTVALGLARALAREGRRPLVVDADVGGPDLHRRAGVDRVPNLADVAAGRDPVAVAHPAGGGGAAAAGNPTASARNPTASARNPTASADGPDVLPAPSPEGADDLGRALRQVAGANRPVVVDCPAGSGPDVATPLRTADRALVVATPRRPGVRGAATVARMARGLGTPVAGAVVTGTDRPPPDATALPVPVLACVPTDPRVRHPSYERVLAGL